MQLFEFGILFFDVTNRLVIWKSFSHLHKFISSMIRNVDSIIWSYVFWGVNFSICESRLGLLKVILIQILRKIYN